MSIAIDTSSSYALAYLKQKQQSASTATSAVASSAGSQAATASTTSSGASSAAQVFDSLMGNILLGYQSQTSSEVLGLGQDAASASTSGAASAASTAATDAKSSDGTRSDASSDTTASDSSPGTSGSGSGTETFTTKESSVDDIMSEISSLLGNYPQSTQGLTGEALAGQYAAYASSTSSGIYSQSI